MDTKFWSVSLSPGLIPMKSNLRARAFCFFLVYLSFFIPVVCSAFQGMISGMQVMPASDSTRIIFKMTMPNKYHVFLLPNPNRLVVDFENVTMRADIKQLNLSHSLVNNARRGWPMPGTSRIVFDLNSRAHFKAFTLTGNNETQLVVDLYAYGAVANSSKPLPQVISTAPAHPLTVKEFDIVTVKQKQKPKQQIVEIVRPRPLVVVVDAGHGGKDPGTIGLHGTQEKNVVLAIALRLADLINEDPKLHASLTRRGDYFVTLKGRLQLARRDKADLFIAIHADSFFNDHSIGASVYALSQHGASSMQARWLADRENHSELGGVDLNGLGDHSYLLRSVLIDLAQTATIIDSVRLGSDMLNSLQSVTSLHYARVEQAPFMVLKSPDIPSILVETGFLSNPLEEERLRDAAYRDKLAHALLAGIRQYVATHPMMASNSKSQNEDIINSQV
jgi:N-acetylmuramoyl-L-alanine amidase